MVFSHPVRCSDTVQFSRDSETDRHTDTHTDNAKIINPVHRTSFFDGRLSSADLPTVAMVIQRHIDSHRKKGFDGLN